MTTVHASRLLGAQTSTPATLILRTQRISTRGIGPWFRVEREPDYIKGSSFDRPKNAFDDAHARPMPRLPAALFMLNPMASETLIAMMLMTLDL